MISLEDVYNIVSAMAPLYLALILGYGSIKWWRLIDPQKSDSINTLVCYFTLPLFTFDFTCHIDPYKLNYRFLGADAISKGITVIVLVLWANCTTKGSYSWSITSFSLASISNTLVVGVPLLKAMYGDIGVDLVVQYTVLQSILWMTILLFVLEWRRSGKTTSADTRQSDLEGGNGNVAVTEDKPSFWFLMKIVSIKLAKNPNCYACFLGVTWALLSSRWHFKMPDIMEGSIFIMSKAGTGTAMFSLGIFMALQEKIISCGAILTVYGMVLRFIAGPATMGIGALALGLRGDVLRIAIIQAALPQAIASFIFAKEYGLHVQVLSTAVIFGTMVSLPVLIGYYAVLQTL